MEIKYFNHIYPLFIGILNKYIKIIKTKQHFHIHNTVIKNGKVIK